MQAQAEEQTTKAQLHFEGVEQETFDELRRRVATKEIRLVLGAGVSMATSSKALSWKETLIKGYDLVKGRDPGWIVQEKKDISEATIPDLLAKAQFLRNELSKGDGKSWAEWLKVCFGDLEADKPHLMEAILDLRLPIMTTNFDDLIEKVAQRHRSRRTPVCWDDNERMLRLEQNWSKSILHLHGIWSLPRSIVFDVASYAKRAQDDCSTTVQQVACGRGVLYIGCGATLDDPNLSSLRGWIAKNAGKTSSIRLVREGANTPPEVQFIEEKLKPLCYGTDYSSLIELLRSLKPVNRKTTVGSIAPKDLRSYAKQVVKHWGVFDLPIAPDTSQTQRGLVEKLYVQRTFKLEAEGSTPVSTGVGASKDTKFTAMVQQGPRVVQLSDRLLGKNPILVVATAGMGKTALTRRLASVYARRMGERPISGHEPDGTDLPERAWVPVIVPGGLVREGDLGGFRSLVDVALRVPGFDRDWKDALCRSAEGYQALLIVDGLDEVAPRKLRADLIVLLGELAESHHQRLFVTSRREGLEADFQKLSPTFERLSLEPLDQEQTQRFLEAYIGPAGNVEASSRRSRVGIAMKDSRVAEVAKTPLGLAMLVQRSVNPWTSGEGLCKLLRWLVNQLIERRGLHLSPPLEERDVLPVLRFLAREMTESANTDALPGSKIEELLSGFSRFRKLSHGRSERDFLKELVESTNLLTNRGIVSTEGIEEATYGFIFKQVREYLAGGDLLWGDSTAFVKAADRFLKQIDRTPIIDFQISNSDPGWSVALKESAFDDRWLSVLALVPGQMVEDIAEATIRHLIEPSSDPRMRRAKVQLAAHALADLSDPTLSTVNELMRACIDVADERDRGTDKGNSSSLSAAIFRLLNSPASDQATTFLAKFAAQRPYGIKSGVVVDWLAEGFTRQRAQLEISGPAYFEDALARVDDTDDAEAAKAAIKLIEVGFRNTSSYLSGIDNMEAFRASKKLLSSAMSLRSGSWLPAWAFSWLVQAAVMDEPSWKVDPRIIAMLKEAFVAPDLVPGARGFLGFALAKLTTKGEDFHEQIYKWAVIADGGEPKAPSKPRVEPSTRLRPTVDFAERFLKRRDIDPADSFYTSLMMARYGFVSDRSAKTMTSWMLERFPSWTLSMEAIVHLGRAGTAAGERALLQIFGQSMRPKEREYAFLALIGNGTRKSWNALLKGIDPSTGDDIELQRRTLEKFLSAKSRGVA